MLSVSLVVAPVMQKTGFHFFARRSNVIKIRVFAWTKTARAWAGAVLSFVLFVIGLSGASLVWKDDYLQAMLLVARVHADVSPDTLALERVAPT